MAKCGDHCSVSSASVDSTQSMFDVQVCFCSICSRSQADGADFRSLASCRAAVLMICCAIVGGLLAVMQSQMMRVKLDLPHCRRQACSTCKNERQVILFASKSIACKSIASPAKHSIGFHAWHGQCRSSKILTRSTQCEGLCRLGNLLPASAKQIAPFRDLKPSNVAR